MDLSRNGCLVHEWHVVACWTIAWDVGVEAVKEGPLSWNWNCGVEGMMLAGVNRFSDRGPSPFLFPRWRGKHEQWDREIHKGSNWLPAQGKSKSEIERTTTHKFQSTVDATW